MTPQPGDFGLTRINGRVGQLIRLGQWLNGSGTADYQHAFIVMPGGMLVEAEPGGARYTPNNYDPSTTVYSSWDLGDGQRDVIRQTAMRLLGTPYSAMDYVSLALHRLHLRPLGLRRYVESSGHMICSQLVDYCYRVAGVPLFHDGRWSGDVTPADLVSVLGGPK